MIYNLSAGFNENPLNTKTLQGLQIGITVEDYNCEGTGKSIL
jgi:hypothetical protein